MSSPEEAVQKLQAAVIDGRTDNIRYRQKELLRLHAALSSEADELCSAIIEDAKFTKLEAEAEYFMTMEALKHFYESLDFDKELKDEYLVATGFDYTTRRTGVGLVVIRPTTHTRLFSILAPVSAAISAGNCVLLELEDTKLKVDMILKRILPKTLDQDTFLICSEQVKQPEQMKTCLLVDQESREIPYPSPSNELVSWQQSRTIAIVDRTSNLEVAAQAIIAARLSFAGKSPYAPDLVIVNEFVKEAFLQACMKYAEQASASQGSLKIIQSNSAEDERKAYGFSTSGSPEVVVFNTSVKRDGPIVDAKISGRYLPIIACSSLTDAISIAQKPGSILLAGYFFADPKAGKYLSQQLNPHITYINQIPSHLLIGPAAPISQPPSLEYRYSKEMFSVLRPQVIKPPSAPLNKIFQLLGTADQDQANSRILRARAVKPLKGVTQGSASQIGFFEQGILVGLSVVGAIVLPTLITGLWFLGKKGLEFAKR